MSKNSSSTTVVEQPSNIASSRPRTFITLRTLEGNDSAHRDGVLPVTPSTVSAAWLDDVDVVLESVTEGEGAMIRYFHQTTDGSGVAELWITPITDGAHSAALNGDFAQARQEVAVVNPGHFANLAV